MKPGHVAEKLHLKDVDFIVSGKERRQYTFGKVKGSDNYSIPKIRKFMQLAEPLLFSPWSLVCIIVLPSLQFIIVNEGIPMPFSPQQND